MNIYSLIENVAEKLSVLVELVKDFSFVGTLHESYREEIFNEME